MGTGWNRLDDAIVRNTNDLSLEQKLDLPLHTSILLNKIGVEGGIHENVFSMIVIYKHLD